MEAEVIQNWLPQVKTVEQFEEAIKATESSVITGDTGKPLYTVVRIPNHIIRDLEEYLQEQGENAKPRDFDDDGYLETFTNEGADAVESLLSHLFTVKAEKTEYEVTITVRVEAFSEDEAEQEVHNNLNDYEWNVEVNEA